MLKILFELMKKHKIKFYCLKKNKIKTMKKIRIKFLNYKKKLKNGSQVMINKKKILIMKEKQC